MKTTSSSEETFHSINAHVNKSCAVFTQDELALFNSLLEVRKVKKKTFLLQQGEICDFEAYINKGCIRNYFINENGSEVILQFGVEDWWVSDIASFHQQQPSHQFIETLEDCELLVLSVNAKEKLLRQIPKFERFFRLMVQRNLSSLQHRLMNTISMTAEEKYLDFSKRYPAIAQRVPQLQIASYLGISAEFLSKVRTRLAKK
ncbi:MAG: Crp/Fnr family transcriptional regulator [Bacteroidota bacterium]